MKTRGAWTLVSITWVFIFSHIAWAQIVVQHQQPTVFNTNEKNHLEFFIPGVNPLDIDEALLFYKNEGDFSYSQIEIPFINGVFKIDLNSDMLTGTSFEYYFKLSLGSQSMDIFYPDTNPLDNPLTVDVIAPETALDSEIERNRLNEIDYTIISPERGSALSTDDAFIAIALYYDIDSIPSGKFRLYLNDKDVTNASDTNKYFISYTPRGLDQGIYQIRLDYSTDKEVFNIADWNFRIVQPEKVSTQSLVPKFKPTGQIELTGRNQVLAGDMNNAYTGRSNLSGSFRKFKYNFNGFLTSQEDPRLQPQNRYSVRMNLGKWWNFEAGHIFPQLSKFTIAGRRIYGINTSVHLLWENINVQFLYGELSRKITNRYTSINEEFVYLDSTQTTIVDTTYTLGLEDRGRGTFKRNIVGGRVALGNPRFFQLGIQALKVEDDTTSIFNVVDYSNIFEGPTSLINGVSMAGQQRLSNSPELLRVQGGGVRPKGNIVAGIDLKFAFDKNRIRFHTETVASALNNDIYGGPLTSERAEELGFEDVDQSELDILRDLTKFIIINENINVLPLRVTGIGTDSTNTEFFFPTGILGSNTEFSLIYPKNTLKLQYRWVGPDFVSLANSTIRKDISGFTFLDRFRVFKNQVYITLGYEYLSDNVTNTKEATTVTSSLRSNLSWYPVNQNLPRISMGLRVRNRDNGVRRFNPFVPKELQSAALQNLVINNDGDTLVTSTPRSNETINYNLSITQQLEINGSVHDATFSLNNLNTSDEVFAFGDIINKSYSFNISSRYSAKSLRTQLGVSINQTKSGSGQLKIDILGIYTGATYFLLNGALKINGRVAYTSNVSDSRRLEIVTEGDDSLRNDYYILSPTKETSSFNTYVLLAGLEYRMTKNQSINFDSNFTSVSGGNGLNDRLIQLRYIYRF